MLDSFHTKFKFTSLHYFCGGEADLFVSYFDVVHFFLEITPLSFCLQVTQSDEPDIAEIPVGLLLINSSPTDATFFCPEKVAVVLEGNRVIDCTTLADGFVMLFGLIYGLHLSYPKDLANTFDFTQKVLMDLDDGKLRPRVLSLKNDLLAME